MTKTVGLGSRLRYPITVVKLHKRPGDKIKKQETLMEYSFKWMKEVGDTIRGETWQQEQTTIVTWDSPSDGELTRWFIREGQHIVSDRVAIEVKEECSHEIQFQGLCGMCGKDMTEVNWATETRDTARAPINMVHDQTNLTVSANHAQRTEQELQRRLLTSRKLSLVVDLDQTIIQACIDPTVGDWQKDPTNPNYESVKGVKSFQLDDGPTQAANQCSYYIKMRPGLESFLKRIAQMYELHVYTMGTRAYAQNVARVVDPDKKLFGNRVISRDENGSIYAKDLQRLFPVSTHMVAIIDDRSDVWPNNRANLIKVSPKRNDTAAEAGNKTAAVGDATLTEWQIEEQKRELEKQIKDRPLQALQEKLDREDEEAAEKATVQSDDGFESRSSSPPSQRHHILQDDDDELEHLQKHLTVLHRTFYAEYDTDRNTVPDAGHILDEFKAKGHHSPRREHGPTRQGEATRGTTTTAHQDRQPRMAGRLLHPNDENNPPNTTSTTTTKTPNGTTPTPFTPTKLRLVAPAGATRTVPLRMDNVEGGNVDGNNDDEDDDDDEAGLLPSDLPDGATSPIDAFKDVDWTTTDAELAEFLASGSDDDEDEEDDDGDDEEESGDGGDGDMDVEVRDAPPPVPVPASTASASVAVVRKRKGRDEEEDEEDGENQNVGGDGDDAEAGEKGENGAPAKRLRRTESQRGSSLRNLYVATGEGADDSPGSGLPTPGRSDGQDVDMEGARNADAGAEGGEEEEEMEFDVAELEAEFEAEFDKAELEAQMAAEQAYGAEVAGEKDATKG
ncbi:hypothetical protein F5144DRAFT_588224 [Chaetomium tenue]|uniref:Uncharacterized protein n=1 Tax=Chaetomium tenue TaxID=1854479 RepID=A0ACB7PKX8_9PEZI|nr:hypothetical protein F5144DRAFT_588224 [Chaetomium globosum]